MMLLEYSICYDTLYQMVRLVDGEQLSGHLILVTLPLCISLSGYTREIRRHHIGGSTGDLAVQALIGSITNVLIVYDLS